MSLHRQAAAFALVSLFALPVFAGGPPTGDVPDDDGAALRCLQLKHVEYPRADRPTAAEASKLLKCGPEDYYYGLGMAVDYRKARHCAFTQKNHDFSGISIGAALAMVYANGLGVPRNSVLAEKAICEAVDLNGRQKSKFLDEVKKQGLTQGAPFDYCILTGGDICGVIAEEVYEQETDAKVASIAKNWVKPSRDALLRLKKIAFKFANSRADAEVDPRRGSYRTQVQNETLSGRADFMAMLGECEAGRLPVFSSGQLAELDRRLNQLYQRVMRQPEEHGVPNDAIKETQREWLVYREAWVEFGAARYPQVPAHAWRAYLTKARVQMLENIFEERALRE